MLLSRFWYLLLAVVAALGVATAMLATNMVNEQWSTAVNQDLQRDRWVLEATLKLDARTRLDAIAPIAANGEVRRLLRRASARRGEAISREYSAPLATRITELNRQLEGMAGDLCFLVDANGIIIVNIGAGNIPPNAGLGHFPLVRRALDGYIRDDVWVFNDGVYRMAARPIIEGGQYVGALVHGKRLDDVFAQLLSRRLSGASVAFFRGERVFASHMPDGVQGAPRRDDIARAIPTALEDEALADGERTDPLPLDPSQAFPEHLGVFSLMTGNARHAQVGYAIARPVDHLATPYAIFERATGPEWEALPWPLLGGGAGLVFVLAMIFMFFERDRPLRRLKAATGKLAQREIESLTVTDWGGTYRKVALDVNDAIDKAVTVAAGQAPRRAAANLDQILGDEPAKDEGGGGFFGFAGDTSHQDFELPPAPGPPARPSRPEAAPAPPKPAPPKPAPPQPAPPKARPKPPPPRRSPTPAPSPPEAAPPSPAEAPAPAAASGPRPPTPAAGQSQRKMLGSTLLGVPPAQPDDEEDDDGATMVAKVPDELLAAASGQPSRAEQEMDAHFREVFQQFVSTKQQCGESTSGLTFEKFSGTLRKNRDQILERHGAKRVRFTVYVKEGKAALKATPIRE